MNMPLQPRAVVDETGINMRAVREELGLTQEEFASLVGYSTRAIQSCEQGWRHPGTALEKGALLLLIAHRNGGDLGHFRCWDIMSCALDRRQRCMTYLCGQGHLCWYLSGTLCGHVHMHHWDDKRPVCVKCVVLRRMLGEEEDPEPSQCHPDEAEAREAGGEAG
jgi:DNA-binding XRE family transcriptional regulator